MQILGPVNKNPVCHRCEKLCKFPDMLIRGYTEFSHDPKKKYKDKKATVIKNMVYYFCSSDCFNAWFERLCEAGIFFWVIN